MPDENVPAWLEWAREIQAICQTGLTYSRTHYDTINYTRLMRIAASMTQAMADQGQKPWDRLFLEQPGYATVKVDVRGAVARDDKILLVRERSDNKWSLPGGWADVGEAPGEMIVREIREESGYIAAPVKVVGVFDANRAGRPIEFFHAYKIIFLCELKGGQPAPSDETSDCGFFAFDDLPELSPNRTPSALLMEIKEHLADPCRPAAFD
ncbi:MAG: NUDIX hydrolase [Desulfovibrio sp.]|uniref:NUDIX hydrolase n=1 Tax=Desulfovibrio sp. 7SRBS1 TaxID=3378064 RepID=UPI003B41E100